MTSSFSISSHSTAGRKADNHDALLYTHRHSQNKNETQAYARTKNEQTLLHFGHCFIICDGVSAAAQGGDGARYTAKHFAQYYYQAPVQWQVDQRGKAALQTINQRLYQQGCKSYGDPQKGFACTFSAVVIHGHKAHIFHVGDTRIYHQTNNEPHQHPKTDTRWQQLTTDHSAATNSSHSYLENAIGADTRLHIEYLCIDIHTSDHFLLSCDGIHDFVDDSSLQAFTSQLNAEGLVNTAFAQGSDDNLSCMAIRIDTLNTEAKYVLMNKHLAEGEEIDQYRLIKQVKHEHLYLNQSQDKQHLYHVFHYRAENLNTGQQCTLALPFFKNKRPVFIEKALNNFYRTYFQLSQIATEDLQPANSCALPTYHYMARPALPIETIADISAKHSQLTIDLLLTWVAEIFSYTKQLKQKGLCISNFDASEFYIDSQGRMHLPFVRLNHIQSELGHFCAPEQKLYNPPPPKDGIAVVNHCYAEVFSCAAMLHEYLTGLHPYRLGMNTLENEVELSRLQYHSLITERSDIPLWFDAALRKALHLNEAERYTSGELFLRDLRQPNADFLDTKFIEQYSRKLPIVPVWKVFSVLWFSSIAVMAYLIIAQ